MNPGDLVRIKAFPVKEIDRLSSNHQIKRKEFDSLLKTSWRVILSHESGHPFRTSLPYHPPAKSTEVTVTLKYEGIDLVAIIPKKWIELVFAL